MLKFGLYSVLSLASVFFMDYADKNNWANMYAMCAGLTLLFLILAGANMFEHRSKNHDR